MATVESNWASAPSVTQLGYLGFGVSNMGEWREFAKDVLGFQESGEGPNGEVYFRWDEYHYRLVLTPTGEDDVVLQGWEVKDSAALEGIAERLRGVGIEVTRATPEECDERMVVGMMKYKDPDGVATEIYYGPYLDQKPFVSPRVTSGFNASTLGLGHIVRLVDDPEIYQRYLTEGLGARVSDYISLAFGGMKLRVTFMHVNPRHHSIAVVPYQKAPAGQPKTKRINHFMVEVNSIDDVGYAIELFKQRDIPMGALGKHTNDHMVSFYGMTPSGFNIEYGTAGRTIDNEDEWEVAHYRAASYWGHGVVRSQA